MRIVIDMQCEQGNSIAVGSAPGDLTRELVNALRGGGDEVVLALSGLLPQSIGQMRAIWEDHLPRNNIRVWYAPNPAGSTPADRARQQSIAGLLRSAFLESLQPDVVLIPMFNASPCEQFIADSAALRFPAAVLTLSDGQILCSTWPSYGLLTSWPNSKEACQELLIVLNQLVSSHSPPVTPPTIPIRPRLAYLSPLPPERSGIADYSAELIPELAKYYDIDVILGQDASIETWISPCSTPRSVTWFLENSQSYDRVLYHFGNSKCHAYLFDLLSKVPGVVVLHDFFLGDIQLICASAAPDAHAFAKVLYHSHGYCALINLFRNYQPTDAHKQFPVNLAVLANAHGVITHSDHARQLAIDWYGKNLAQNWSVIPLMRTAARSTVRERAREQLGLRADAFVVGSFGLISPLKLNLSLLQAWLRSQLAKDPRCILLFIGDNDAAEYGRQMSEQCQSSGVAGRVHITGWIDKESYDVYLAAVDVAVQLRVSSRGETSAAVLDCMNHGLPTIVNASGSMTELPQNTVRMLPEYFEESQLIDALESFWTSPQERAALGTQAQEHVWTHHNPQVCAHQYVRDIERFYSTAPSTTQHTIDTLCQMKTGTLTDEDCLVIAGSIAQMQFERKASPQICVDVSATCRKDLKTGIQRVVRALVTELVRSPPDGFRIEPVYLCADGGRLHYRYARKWTSDILSLPKDLLHDEPAVFAAGDLLLVADYTGDYIPKAEREGVFARLRVGGVGLHFVVYDLLPIQMPEVFPPGLHGFGDWLGAMSRVADSAICISRATATALQAWFDATPVQRIRPIDIRWFHLGADVENSAPSFGLPPNASATLKRLEEVPSFLMVGTVEPRKNYRLALDAFSLLWNAGVDVNLVVVGHEGWNGMADDLRRDIPETVRRLRSHPRLGSHLFWLEGISDEYLNMVYEASTCLIAASKGEGFGLPLIEAAQRGLPILASDIAVFHEVAGSSASYFAPDSPAQLADAVTKWLEQRQRDRFALRPKVKTFTWKESANQLIQGLCESNCHNRIQT
jgi:glycosyltransferase involved in cell wall biosynthesis